MNILVTGAELENKGAESMLYITTDEMRKRFPDSTIYFATINEYDEDNYTFKKFYMSGRGLDIAVGGLSGCYAFIKGICKDAIKYCVGKRTNLGHYFDVRNHFNEIDIIIDISGFNLGKQWSKRAHTIFLNRLELAKRYNIPVYLMPQSFGPFDYERGMERVKKRMAELLPYPRLIFAREKEGYDDLIRTFGLHNVVQSTDLVLQNAGIDLNNVFTSEPVISVPKIPCENGTIEAGDEKVVGIIPNQQCFKHGDRNWNLKVYQAIISHLLKDGYRVVVFRHSKEDNEIGQMIKALFRDIDEVSYESKEFSCLEYDKYVRQFSFIICSRFHGIVHAYRNSIPVIALGWAIKYQGLTDCVGQGKYCFDITKGKSSIEEIVAAIKDMEENYVENSRTIGERVNIIQKSNCFDLVETVIKE